VMREIVDVLLGLLACLQVAYRDDMMRPSGEYDRPQNEFDRGRRAVALAQSGFDRQVGAGKQFGARGLVGKTAFEPCADQVGRGQPGQGGETCVD
jgi:hypothetical protein